MIELERILQNLCDNAITFNRESGKVLISAIENGGTAAISVRDTGPGIPAEQLPYLFQGFSQRLSARATGKGSGLGLLLVKSLVGVNGGQIDIASGAKGTTFTFTLPLVS